MANDVLSQLPVEVIIGPLPAARSSQAPLEVIYTMDPPEAEGPFAEAVLALNPWLYYKLGDPGALAWDYSGNARHGTYYGAPTQEVAGVLLADDDGAALFDAVDDRVLSHGIFNSAAATVIVFFEYGGVAPASSGFIAGCAEGQGSNSSDKVLFVSTAGKAAATAFDGGGKTATDPANLTAGWHMLVLRADGSTLDLWVDGVEKASVACGATYTGYGAPNVQVAGKNDFTGPTRMAGKRDEFILFADDLTDPQIVGLWEASLISAGSLEFASLGGIGIGGGAVVLEVGKSQGIRIGEA